ncbi:hypothetical protein EJB05_44417, partial [Eragrostis curvula]
MEPIRWWHKPLTSSSLPLLYTFHGGADDGGASAQETATGNPPGGCLCEIVLANGGAAHLGLLDGHGAVTGSVRCRRSEADERAQVAAQIQAERLGGSIGMLHARGSATQPIHKRPLHLPLRQAQLRPQVHPVIDSQLGFVFIAHLLEHSSNSVSATGVSELPREPVT